MKTFDEEKFDAEKDDSRRESIYSTATDAVSKIKSVMMSVFYDFSNNSTVHGVKYLGEHHRHWIEKVFWLIAFCISFTGSLIYIIKIYEKWQLSPVIVSFAEKATLVWQIPFPAVTICPETKAKKERIDFSKVYKLITENQRSNATSEELRNLEALAQVCHPYLFSNTSLDSDLESYEIVPLLKSLTMTLNETIIFCKWRNSVDGCEKYFSEIITEEGFCYTFNVLNSKELFRENVLSSDFNTLSHNDSANEWSLDDGYSTNKATTYPRRVYDFGARSGLNFVLKLKESDLDYLCRWPVQGFKILLHMPGETPRVSKQYFRISLGQDVVVSVKPNMITTSEGLVDYSPERRQCYFDHERNLTFFRVYTQKNCELECLAAFTLKQCGCVQFSMPRDNKTRICLQSEVSCYNAAEDNLLLNDLLHSLSSSSGLKKIVQSDCNCLPSCTSINYDAEISKAKFEFVKAFNAYGSSLNKFPGSKLTRLTIFFKEAHFITAKRAERFGLTDFLSHCGGIVGLFIGVSILSLVEILYYITLRLVCNFNFYKSQKDRKNCEIVSEHSLAEET